MKPPLLSPRSVPTVQVHPQLFLLLLLRGVTDHPGQPKGRWSRALESPHLSRAVMCYSYFSHLWSGPFLLWLMWSFVLLNF